MKIAVIVPNYNSATLVERCASAMLRQAIAANHSLEVVIVDDGSTDDSAARLENALGEQIRLIRHATNLGRSSARNTGAHAADCDLLIFVDSDCVPPDPLLLSGHADAVANGADVSFGEVETPGGGFWDQLQQDASKWRARRFNEGQVWAFTTQNVAIRKDVFVRVGGFDPVFDRYGFEDRDLFVRIAGSGARMRYTPQARVTHEDNISLRSVSTKLGAAGYHAAHVFRARHPQVYGEMSFSRIDAQLHPMLAVLDALLWPLFRALASLPASWLEFRWLPFRCRAFAARSIYGMSFLHGTSRRRAETTAQHQ